MAYLCTIRHHARHGLRKVLSGCANSLGLAEDGESYALETSFDTSLNSCHAVSEFCNY